MGSGKCVCMRYYVLYPCLPSAMAAHQRHLLPHYLLPHYLLPPLLLLVLYCCTHCHLSASNSCLYSIPALFSST